MKNQDKLAQPDLLKQNLDNPDNPRNPINLPSPKTSGPRFDLDNKGGWGEKFRGWINKYGSSVVLPIIALLILAGGIYLYSNQKSREANFFLEENSANIQEQLPSLEGEETAGISQEISQVTEEKTQEGTIEKIIPEGRKEGGAIIEKAAKGDGVTHLARRALKDYLEDNPQELTNEHKIYIEDYLKDKVGPRPLEVDEEITFSEDLIKEAIDASLELNPEQLKNLEKYSALVAW
jgi:hypothetical protein